MTIDVGEKKHSQLVMMRDRTGRKLLAQSYLIPIKDIKNRRRQTTELLFNLMPTLTKPAQDKVKRYIKQIRR